LPSGPEIRSRSAAARSAAVALLAEVGAVGREGRISEQQRLRRRSARSERQARRLGLGPLLKMGEDALDELRLLDAGDDPELSTAQISSVCPHL